MDEHEKDLTLIAFDFGLKRIGVAVGQTITGTANPLEFLPADGGKPNWDQFRRILQHWKPDAIVIGIPYNSDGSEQPITQKARVFVQEMKTHTDLPVYEVDERFTTIEARQRLFEMGGFRALKEISIDSFAAKVILESWMTLQKGGS